MCLPKLSDSGEYVIMSAGSQGNLTARIFFRDISFDIHSLLNDIFRGETKFLKIPTLLTE